MTDIDVRRPSVALDTLPGQVEPIVERLDGGQLVRLAWFAGPHLAFLVAGVASVHSGLGVRGVAASLVAWLVLFAIGSWWCAPRRYGDLPSRISRRLLEQRGTRRAIRRD